MEASKGFCGLKASPLWGKRLRWGVAAGDEEGQRSNKKTIRKAGLLWPPLL